MSIPFTLALFKCMEHSFKNVGLLYRNWVKFSSGKQSCQHVIFAHQIAWQQDNLLIFPTGPVKDIFAFPFHTIQARERGAGEGGRKDGE